jgi:hypothetical protein
VVHALQRAPAALGLQRGNAVVLYLHPVKHLAQRRFEHSRGPVVGQTALCAGHAATDIRRRQFHQPLVQHKRAAGGHTDGGDVTRVDMRCLAAGANHAQHLPGQRIGCALFGGRLDQPAESPTRVNHVDRHLGAANVNANHGRRPVIQA